jgi:hypothetical protein
MTARGDSLGCSRNLGSNYYAGLTHQSMIDLDADDAAKVSAFHSLGVGKAGGELLRSSPPLDGASVLSASRFEPLVPFPFASPPRFSRSVQEPGRASRRLHAGCRSVSLRTSPSSSRRMGQPPVLTSPNLISTLLQRFAYARLSRPCLLGSCPNVSATFTTIAFDDSSLQWLEIST